MELLPSCEAGDTKGWHKVGTICRRCGSEVRPIISATEPNAMNNEQHNSLSFTRIEVSGPESEKMLDRLEEHASKHAHLTQLLGISLRGILPYAENEISAIGELVDGSTEAAEEYDVACVNLDRARAAIKILEQSPYSIEGVENDAFDEEFQITFDLPDEE